MDVAAESRSASALVVVLAALLASYKTSIEEDEALLAGTPEGLSLREEQACRARMEYKKVMAACMHILTEYTAWLKNQHSDGVSVAE